MMKASNILVLTVVLLTENIASIEAAAGDWTNPVIGKNGGTGTIPQAVPENRPPGRQTSAFVAAEGATSYKILSQDVDGLFALQTNGSINLTSKLDYENVTSYTLVVVATGDHVVTTATVTVKIEDINDNVPVFSSDPYFIRLPDNSTAGTFVTKVTATDADVTLYNHMISKYAIKDGLDKDYFFIVPSTGEVFVNKDKTLSSTTKANYTFKVEAQDTGSPYRVGTADITVCVTCKRTRSGEDGLMPSTMLVAFSIVLLAF